MVAVTVEMTPILGISIEKWHMAGHFYDSRSFLRKRESSKWDSSSVNGIKSRIIRGEMAYGLYDMARHLRKRESFEWKWF